MFFGVSYGEILVLLGAGAVIFGPKDLPVLARSAGLLTGRAAAYLTTARNRILGFAEQNQVTQLHQEVQESLQQLRAIRAELRGGINLFAPGPQTSRIMQRVSGLPAEPQPTAVKHSSEECGLDVSLAEWRSHGSAGLSSESQVPEAQQELLAAAHVRLHDAQQQVRQQQQAPPLPVSAVAAGCAKLRSDGMPHGSDIMADALAEEEVARAAQHFMQQQQHRPP